MHSPPFALAPLRFPFPALATCIEGAPLGGPREVCVAALQVARLVHASRLAAFGIQARSHRATATKSWLASMALPPGLLQAFSAVALATGRSAPVLPADPQLVHLARLLEPYLEPPARTEFAQLAGVEVTQPVHSAPAADRPRHAIRRTAGSPTLDQDTGRGRSGELNARQAPHQPAPR